MMAANPDIFDWIVQVKDLARNGLSLSYEADDAELEALKLAYDLHSASCFRLDMDLHQGQQGLMTLKGRLTVKIEQNCVVTLQPVGETMDIDYQRRFIREADNSTRKKKRGDQRRDAIEEVLVEPFEDDPPDILAGNSIDFGKIALEEFSLELNPYPRHDDAPGNAEFSFSGNRGDGEKSETRARPFAALKKIQSGSSGDQ